MSGTTGREDLTKSEQLLSLESAYGSMNLEDLDEVSQNAKDAKAEETAREPEWSVNGRVCGRNRRMLRFSQFPQVGRY